MVTKKVLKLVLKKVKVPTNLGARSFLSEAIILSPKTVRFQIGDPKHGMFIIFRNKLNGFWVFYYGTNLSAGSHN